jgi:hypothetical protein
MLVLPQENVIISPLYAAKTLAEILENLQNLDLSNYVENIAIKYVKDCQRISVESELSMIIKDDMKDYLLKSISIIISNSTPQ